MGARCLPLHVTTGCSFNCISRSSFSRNSDSYCARSYPNNGNDSMNDPRPAVISARPLLMRSMVAKSWNTRTGSSDDSTVTALVSLMREVRAAAAASTMAGDDTGKSGRWCSPTPKMSRPTWSASSISSTNSRTR